MFQNLSKILEGDNQFAVGEIIEIVTEQYQYKDGSFGSNITGEAKVRILSGKGVTKAIWLTSMGGSSAYMGGVPEVKSLVFMINKGTPGNASYIILGTIPIPVSMMINYRKEIEKLVSGEILLQGSARGRDDFWRSANLKIDQYGRMIIRSGDDSIKITVGDLLSNEYTPETIVVRDSITNQTVCYEQKFGKYSNRIDRQGNYIQRWFSILSDVEGDVLQLVKGRFIVTTTSDIRLESKGSFLAFEDDGVQLYSLKDLEVSSVGNIDISATGAVSIMSFANLVLMSNTNAQIKTIQDLLMTCANLNIISNQATTLTSVLSATISSQVDINLLATAFVRLGSLSATQSVIRGELFDTWISNPAGHLDGFGFPITRTVPFSVAGLLSSQIKVP